MLSPSSCATQLPFLLIDTRANFYRAGDFGNGGSFKTIMPDPQGLAKSRSKIENRNRFGQVSWANTRTDRDKQATWRMFASSAVGIFLVQSADLFRLHGAHRLHVSPFNKQIGKVFRSLTAVKVPRADNAIDDSPAGLDINDIEKVPSQFVEEAFIFRSRLNLTRRFTSGKIHSDTTMGVVVIDGETSATSRIQWYKGVLRLELYQVSRALPQRFEPLPRRRRRMLPAPS